MNACIDDKKVERNIRLSLSENPYGMCNEAINVIKKESENGFEYPDTDTSELCEKISEIFGVSSDMVFCANGTDEVILVATLAFINQNKYGLTTKSTFKGFSESINFIGAKCIYVDLEEYSISAKKIMESMNENIDVIYICNPHNPTGTIMNEADLESIIKLAKKYGSIVIIDEAYAEYANSNVYSSALKYVKAGERVIITRTFSKIYGLAGLRCGYAIGHPHLIDKMKQVKKSLPYNVNILAQKAALASIQCPEFIQKVKKNNNKVKEWFYNQLNVLDVQYVRSETNFVLIKVPVDSKMFCKELYSKYGILVKDAGAFGFDNHIRVSLGSYETMVYVVDCFKKILNRF
ncbi:MAG: histidinol-phosphate aminotransferase family protein [Clostridium sp.]|nr:histidinol-phosphate aminotransferase family protein [Clostridium sp.]